MENYKDYKTVQQSSQQELASSVRTWMKEGWVPLGGVSIAATKVDKFGNVKETGKEGLIYTQALVMPA